VTDRTPEGPGWHGAFPGSVGLQAMCRGNTVPGWESIAGGAVVLLIGDRGDRGDPGFLGEEMAPLRRRDA
jgi:hypothetical protein